MLLTVDVGNTNIVLGLWSGDALVGDWRMRTDARITADELALTVRGLLGPHADAVTGISALSTVPAVLRELRVMLGRYYAGVPKIVVEPGVRTGVALLVDNPKEVGADRLANTLAAHHLHRGTACVVVDFGTSTNVDAISARGEFLGGAFAPGIEISVDALALRAAALRKVELAPPRSVIGKNTVECLQSGILYGFAGQVDGLVRRIVRELSPSGTEPVAVLATGGLAPLVLGESETITDHVPELTLLGLRLVYERNIRP
ncbi:type III pantothenate kinase [Amycolatopsis sp. A133]|uniref:type III pantothenate kinase n=1 Tax=Amycolatopsis sp. A133 TaxID=3064472 RepID=UPI0027EAB928|nr:type III pantothenate kinase [Amycolatopsis sp. A133]MDQ7808092.1 type III pantothenate kinase [Amycolatopsis sp. A133]